MVYDYEMNDRNGDIQEEGKDYFDYDKASTGDGVHQRYGKSVEIVTTNGGTIEHRHAGVHVTDGVTRTSYYGNVIEEEKNPRMASAFQKNQFTILLLICQIIFFVLFGLFAKYDATAMPSPTGADDPIPVAKQYPLFQDTHVMIFIGFGFLMTFLRRYGFSALSVNMLLACFTIEWGMIVRGMLGHDFAHHGYFTIGLEELLTADFAAAVVLISMGAMLGKLSPVQYLVMALIEVPVSLFVEHHVVHTFMVNDVGGSIIVHAFGAYFGLACAKAMSRKSQPGHEHEGSTYNSDILAMIGAIFLWVFWPSFNAAVAEPADARQRAVINTFLSLVGSTIATFLVSQATDHHRKFDMVHIANSTLAGGVAIGTCANVVLSPLHALIVGFATGVISVVGYKYITPFLTSKLGMHDTCGVHNLHGMPGVIAGLASVVFALHYDPASYGKSLNIIYPGIKSEENETGFDQTTQAIRQLAGVGTVLITSVISGYVCGLVLKLKVWNQVREKEIYSDVDYFETPSDFDFVTRVTSCIDHIDIAESTPLKSVKTMD